jgi:hypothetical protein
LSSVAVVWFFYYLWTLDPQSTVQFGGYYVLLKPALIYLLAAGVIYVILSMRVSIYNFVTAVRVYLLVEEAKRKLRAVNKSNLADELKWDEKWFGK